MKFSASLIVTFTLYSLLGICPMQLSMMTPMPKGDMTMVTTASTSKSLGPTISKMNNCGSCIKAVDNFALKDVQLTEFNGSSQITHIPYGYRPVNTDLGSSKANFPALARAGPVSLAPSIVKTVVLRT